MSNASIKAFHQAAGYLCSLSGQVMNVSDNIAANAVEIRLRTGRPIIIETPFKRYVIGNSAVTAEQVAACIKSFCDYSIYSCARELSEGFITLKGGHRAGFSGSAVYEESKIVSIRDISSINLRIAREHNGIADEITEYILNSRNFRGMLVIGEPLSGKTTILRDITRRLGNVHKIAVVDERREIASVYRGVPQHSIGMNTDVLDGFLKADGIETAVRSLSPKYIVCDEISSDFVNMCRYISNGVRFILSAHCSDIEELKRSSSLCGIVENAGINSIVLLDSGEKIGKVKGMWYIADDEDIFCCDSGSNLCNGRNLRRKYTGAACSGA